MDVEETPPEFNPTMYPRGINADFDVSPDALHSVEGTSNSSCKTVAEDILSRFKERFENPELRDIARNVPKLMQLCSHYGLEHGNIVVDLGSGTGLLLQPLADAVGHDTGTVVSTEVSKVFHDALVRSKQCAAGQLDNVTLLLNKDERDPQLQLYEGVVDLILVVDVYHHLQYPRTVMRHLLQAARRPDGRTTKGGRLVVVDFVRDEKVHTSHPGAKIPTGAVGADGQPEFLPWILAHVRAGQEVFWEEIASAGWVLEREILPTGVKSVLPPGAVVGTPEDLPEDFRDMYTENFVMIFRPQTEAEQAQVGAGWATGPKAKGTAVGAP